MMEVKKIINNDFKEVTIKFIDSKLVIIVNSLDNKYVSIPCYNDYLENMRGKELINYLLETFLNNNTIMGVEYCDGIHISTLVNKINIYLDITVFPDLILKIEQAKRESVINYLKYKDKPLEITFDNKETGLIVDNFKNPTYIRYIVLNNPNEIKDEMNLLKALISRVDYIDLEKLNKEIDLILSFKKYPEFRIGNIIFNLSNCSFENIKKIRELINANYLNENKQMVLKMGGKYEFNNGKVS